MEASGGGNPNDPKLKEKSGSKVGDASGVNNYNKAWWKLRIRVEGSQIPNPST
jgi:hypothetical protein